MIVHWRKLLFISILAVIFFWTRLYRLDKTLEFFADMGRDHYVLLKAIQTKKPPLLGPSTSALPINQSPVYFYLNFPLFVLSGYSAYTTIWTLLMLFVCASGIGLYALRDENEKFWLFASILSLLTLHPEFVAQTRYAWNPTYTVPFLLLAIASILLDFRTKKITWMFSASIAIAVGCSYSILPAVSLLLLFVHIRYPQIRKLLWISVLCCGAVVFLPLGIVDLRTHGLLSTNIFGALGQTRLTTPLWEKAQALLHYSIGTHRDDFWRTAVSVIILFLSLGSALSHPIKSIREKQHIRFTLLFVFAFVATVLTPFLMQSHYIFGVTLLLFASIVTMKKPLMLVGLVVLMPTWFTSITTQLQTSNLRTVTQLEACAQIVCQSERTPIYVAEQAWHSYHFAPDHLFFFNKHGCDARDIAQDPGYAQTMALVVDQSTYTHGQTSFHELSLFGTSTVRKTYSCPGKITVLMLERMP